jgi:hypothetical protein
VCLYCESVAVYTDSLGLRAPTADESQMLSDDPAIKMAQACVRALKARSN